ncbi:hypothetical protein G7Z17_g1754 [Cylindrodendrum hubeiense]|uniref:Uncharacterized protein n=1 Tax=Cylindrodendrum hubeiense TaxID=595255 RepID=A0A9P5LC96_9HYPO|nr:hypothetical protein G7Z17_g1754 [Cylindrodendrum hubeiense]
MYMYYHTARIVLCHHEVLHLDTLRAGTETSYSLAKDLSTIFETRRELQNATSDITECHKELLHLGLIQWLPSSAIGFILLPLILNILDIKLLQPMGTDIDRSLETTQQQLNVLIQFMKVYWPRFDGIDWVSEIIRHIVSLAQLDDSKVQRKNSSINWADIFVFQPRSYLRLVLALDLSLSKGRLPQDWDFPVKLRGLFSFNANPLRELVESHCTNVDNAEDANPLIQTRRPEPPEFMAGEQIQHNILGLDECLIATLENQFAFGGSLGLLEVAHSENQREEGTPSDHSESSSDDDGSSRSLQWDDKGDSRPNSRTASEFQGSHDRKGEDAMGERVIDGLMEDMLEGGFSECIN